MALKLTDVSKIIPFLIISIFEGSRKAFWKIFLWVMNSNMIGVQTKTHMIITVLYIVYLIMLRLINYKIKYINIVI